MAGAESSLKAKAEAAASLAAASATPATCPSITRIHLIFNMPMRYKSVEKPSHKKSDLIKNYLKRMRIIPVSGVQWGEATSSRGELAGARPAKFN